MSNLVSALWKYAGYSSLARSLFDAESSPRGGEIPATPLAESAASSTSDRTSSGGFERRHLSDTDSAESGEGEGDYDSDDEEALLAWACNLSSDEDEDQEAEEEEDSAIAEFTSGYESDISCCENEECRYTDGESHREQLYTISL